MSNIIISPQSGILEFNTGAASGSAFDGSLSGAARLKFESSGVLGLTSLGTGVTDKFTIDGSNGRLFTVNNTVTGSIFSVNDVAGLPIVEVFSDDRVVMGQYATDALVVSGSGVSFATTPTVNGNPIMTGVNPYDEDTLATVTARGSSTTNPISALAITGTAGLNQFKGSTADSASHTIVARNSSNTSLFSIRNDGRVDIPVGPVNIGNNLYLDNNEIWAQNSNNLNVKAAGDVKIQTNDGATTAATFKSDGNVGIGTTNPSYKLEVDGGDFLVNTANGGYFQVDESDNSVKFSDLVKAKFGTHSDLEIYHGGNSSRIDDVGTGGLYLRTNGPAIYFQDTDSNALAQFTDGGSCFLMHNGTIKFNTISDGAVVSDKLRIGTSTQKGIGGNEIFTISGGGAAIPSQTWTNAHSSALYLRNYNNAAGEWQLQPYNGGNGGVIQLAPYGGNVTIGNLTASAKLDIRSDAGSSSIRCESSTGAYFIVAHGGKLGIQTSSPQYALHIDNNGNNNPANVLIDSTTTADASISFSHNGTFGYTIGTDESDGKLFKISSGSALGTNDRLTVNGVGLKVEGIVQADVFNTKANDGNIIYRSDSRTFVGNAGNNGLIVLDNGNVGIGRTDPNRDLSIVGQIGIDNSASSPSAGMLIAPDGTSNKIYSRTANNIATAHPFDFYAGSTHTLRIASNGNVGIGTTNPDEKLRVVGGNVCVTNGQYFIFDGAGSKNHKMRSYYDGSQGHVEVIVGGTDVLDMAADGKVGIGTAAPSDKLHVWGSVRGDLKLEGNYQGGATDVGKFTYAYAPRGGDHNNRTIASISAYNTTTDSTAGGYLSISTRATNSTNQERIRVNQDGQVDIYGNASFAQHLYHKGDEDTNIKFNTDEVIIHAGDVTFFRATETTQNTIKLNSDSTDADFYLYSTSSTPAIFMRGSDGQVGIGTTNPAAKLHVHDGHIRMSNGYKIDWGGTNVRIDGDNSSDYFRIFTSSTERLRVDTDGNVGIGVTDPDHKLHVNGTIAIKGGELADTARIHFQASDESNRFTLESDFNSSTTTDLLGFRSTTADNILVLKGNGNVGIGTTNPQGKLSIIDTTSSNSLRKFHVGRSTNAGLYITDNDNTTFIRAIQDENEAGYGNLTLTADNIGNRDGYISFMTDTEHVRIKSDGNVGIGTTNPAAKLHIDVTTEDNQPALRISKVSDQNENALEVHHGTTSSARGIADFTNSAGSVLHLRGDRKVGIGTISPAATLDILGDNSSNAFNIIQGAEVAFRFSTYIEPTTAYTPVFRQGLYYNTIENATIGYCRGGSSVGGFLTFQTNGAEKMRLDANGRLGIGTTNPTQALEVHSTIKIGETAVAGGRLISADSMIFQIDCDNTSSTSSYRFRKDSTVDAGTELMRIQENGNVGIGVVDPDAKLEVAGKTHLGGRGQDGGAFIADGYATFSETNGGAATILGNAVYAGAASSTIRKTKNEDGNYIKLHYLKGLTFHTKATGNAGSTDYSDDLYEKMRINLDGNVGIGTTDPSTAKLRIKGTTNDTSALTLQCIDSSNAQTFFVRNDGVVQVTDNYFYVSSNAGAYVQHDLRVRGSLSNDGGALVVGGDVNFDSNTLYVDSSTNRIGIGTTNPQEELDLRGDMRLDSAGNTDRSIYFRNQSSIAKVRSDAALQFDVGVSSSPTAAMYIEEDTRNVGIGTTGPAYKLDVVHSDGGTLARFKDSDSSHAGLLIQGDTNGGTITNAAGFTSEVIYLQNSANAMRFYTDGTEAVRIDSSQRVGIGTNSVNGFTHINGRMLVEGPTVPSTLAISDSGDASKNLRLGYEPTWDVGSISASDFGAGWKNIVIAPHAGKVGIGTTAPHQALSVKGTIVTYNSSYVQVAGMTNSSNHGRLYANNSAGVTNVLLDSDGVSYLNGGNVGIGSNTPAEALDVVGLIRFGHTRADNAQKIARLLVPEYNNSHGQFLAFMGTANQTSNAVSFGGGTSSADAATTLLFYTASAVNTEVGTERMRITSAGNVGIGVSTDPSSKLHVNGELTASTKTFDIEHPTQSGKRLIHGCFEGPEHGVYFRGKTQNSGIQAPEYWSGLVDMDSMTVDVTPIGANQSIYVDRIEDNGDVYVGANTEVPLNYFYIVYGERKDIDPLVVVKDAPAASPNEHID
jgi:hypothetical protein